MSPLISSILYSLFIENNNKNWVFSPASYLEAMGNLSVCLKDDNLKELLAVAPDVAETNFKGLESFNCLLHSEEYRTALNEAVVAILASRGANLESFSGVGDAADKVNRIVNEKTHGMIKQLLTPEDFTEFTKFIILNCVYFKANWLYKLSKRDWEECFNGATKVSQVKFLGEQHRYRYFEGEGYDIVELPYKESDIACYLFVPTTASLFSIFNNLTDNIGKISQVKSLLEVNLTVPEFKTETTIPLNKLTQIAGVNKIFEPNQDWTLIEFKDAHEFSLLGVEKIIQKAAIDFTERGTEAAAATAITMLMISGCAFWPREIPKIKFVRADKPFAYILADKTDFKPLFVGVFNDIPDNPQKSIKVGSSIR